MGQARRKKLIEIEKIWNTFHYSPVFPGTEHLFLSKDDIVDTTPIISIGEQVKSKQAAEIALKAIRARSFSERHLELGKMINCVHCDTRHRKNERVCEQRFATGRYDISNPKPLLIAGQTPETQVVPPHQPIKAVVGAAMFKGKRRHPPLNWRSNLFVQLVRSLIPDEYTQEELQKARTKARRILANRYGRFGFLPPVWQRKEENGKAVVNTRESTQAS